MSETEFFLVKEHVTLSSHVREYPGATIDQNQPLRISLKQYTPKKPVTDTNAVTFISAPACGFNKEVYEPLWDELYRRSEANGFAIRGIWMADSANFGQSGILNEGVNSDDISWMDHSRDMLLFINQFRDQMPRPLVGLGHSFGGSSMLNLALMHPRLFTSVIVLDPVVQMTQPKMGFNGDPPGNINFVVHRQDLWPNRKAAAQFFGKISKGWDQRLVDRMVKYGFRDLPTPLYPELPEGADPNDPPVTLTATKHHESLASIRANFDTLQPDGSLVINRYRHPDMDPSIASHKLYRAEPPILWTRLPELRPSLMWVIGGKTFLNIKSMQEGIRRAGTGVGGSGGMEKGRVKEVMLKDHGHLLAFSALLDTADECCAWVGSELVRYRQDEDKWNQARAKRTPRDHLTLDEEWYRVAKPLSAFKRPKL